MNHVNIVTIESDLGAGVKGAKLGPTEILKILKENNLKISDIVSIKADEIIGDDDNYSEYARNISDIVLLQQNIYQSLSKVLQDNRFPLIFSGDHSSASAIISAIKDYYPDKKIGVIWIDAHADLHTPYTTPSGNMHGMPLAICLGLNKSTNYINTPEKFVDQYWKKLLFLGSKNINPKILPQHIVYIGLRDYEEIEKQLIDNLKIKYFTVDEVRADCEYVANKTLSYLNQCDYIFVSFDVDSLDPSISSGTGTPVPNGLYYDEARLLLYNFLSAEKTVAFEITEVNPILDRINPMEKVAARLIFDLFR